MKTWNSAAQALLARHLAGERIDFVPLIFADLDVPQYYAVCGYPLVWDGHTWEPRDFGISAVSSNVGEYPGLTLTLPGVDEAQIALAFDEVDGATLRLYVAIVDPDTGEVADAMQMWSGELDIPGWQDGAEASVIFTAEHRGSLALQPKVRRYTSDEQQRIYPGDTSLDQDPATDASGIVWPSAAYWKQ